MVLEKRLEIVGTWKRNCGKMANRQPRAPKTAALYSQTRRETQHKSRWRYLPLIITCQSYFYPLTLLLIFSKSSLYNSERQKKKIEKKLSIHCLSVHQRWCGSQKPVSFLLHLLLHDKRWTENTKLIRVRIFPSFGLAWNHDNDETEMRNIMMNSRKSRSHPHSRGRRGRTRGGGGFWHSLDKKCNFFESYLTDKKDGGVSVTIHARTRGVLCPVIDAIIGSSFPTSPLTHEENHKRLHCIAKFTKADQNPSRFTEK